MVVGAKLGSAQAMPETKLGCLALRADKEFKRGKKKRALFRRNTNQETNI